MTEGAPRQPRCALARWIGQAHDVFQIKWRLFHRDKHLWVDLNDETLTAEQRNMALYLGNSIYGKGMHG